MFLYVEPTAMDGAGTFRGRAVCKVLQVGLEGIYGRGIGDVMSATDELRTRAKEASI